MSFSQSLNAWIDAKEGTLPWKVFYRPLQVLVSQGVSGFWQSFEEQMTKRRQLPDALNAWIVSKEHTLLWKLLYRPFQVLVNQGVGIFLQRIAVQMKKPRRLSAAVNEWIDARQHTFLWKILYRPFQVLANQGVRMFLKRAYVQLKKLSQIGSVNVVALLQCNLRKFARVYYYDPLTQKKCNVRKVLSSKKRREGISGFMRVKNEEAFLASTIESVIDALDELVIVYNDCTDSTPQIIDEYQKKYPNKIQSFHYEPIVYPQGSKEFQELPPDSPHSLVNYYNFALVQTNYSVALKIDGDEVFIPHLLRKTTNNIRKYGLNTFLLFGGVNLWDEHGEVYVNGNRPIMGNTIDRDRGFFPVSKDTYHIKNHRFEKFVCPLHQESIGILFYHLKGMKPDKGLNVYQLEENPHSYGHSLKEKFYNNPTCIRWEDFQLSEQLATFLPEPEKCGI